jgi:hypothetical protein
MHRGLPCSKVMLVYKSTSRAEWLWEGSCEFTTIPINGRREQRSILGWE